MTNKLKSYTAKFEDGSSYSIPASELSEVNFAASVPTALCDRHGSFTVESTTLSEDAKEELLFGFHWDCGRMGSVESKFVATQAAVDAVIGRFLYFGEILGKHSEVSGTLDTKDFTVVSSDFATVQNFKKTVGSTGHNPFDYFED